jgi:hypothetical protein
VQFDSFMQFSWRSSILLLLLHSFNAMCNYACMMFIIWILFLGRVLRVGLEELLSARNWNDQERYNRGYISGEGI